MVRDPLLTIKAWRGKRRRVVALGRKAGKKGGPARVPKPTTEEPSEAGLADTSDQALAALLNRLKATVDPPEIRHLSEQTERIVFHKQFTNA